MSGVLESHFVTENIRNQPFPQNAGLRMALESSKEGNNILQLVELDAETAEVPVVNSVINFEITVN